METVERIIGIILAFTLSTLVGYVFWYIARGHRLKEKREQLKQQKQDKADASIQKKKKSDAESINEVMGYDFIPMRSINRKEDSSQEEKVSDKEQPAQKQPKAVSQKEKTVGNRNWNNSHSEEFEEQTGKLGISSNNHEETEPEPETESYSGYQESWPETTEEEIDSYEEQMRKWAEDESAFGDDDETTEKSENKEEDSFDEFEDIWDGAMEQRNEDKEDIRKKSLSIGKIGNDSSSLSDDEIDDLQMNG